MVGENPLNQKTKQPFQMVEDIVHWIMLVIKIFTSLKIYSNIFIYIILVIFTR